MMLVFYATVKKSKHKEIICDNIWDKVVISNPPKKWGIWQVSVPDLSRLKHGHYQGALIRITHIVEFFLSIFTQQL